MQSNKEIIEILKKYRELLIQSDIDVKDLYLYGSQAKGTANEDSDIDVFVVSSNLNSTNYLDSKKIIWKLTRGIDSRIEPVIYSSTDFVEEDPLAYEVMTNGIRLT